MASQITYGAWIIEETAGRRVIAKIEEDDFRRELKLAFFETKDLDRALNIVRLMLVQKVRAALT